MSERELRDGLALAVADEPPLNFDPETVVTRAKRETKRRRALVGVGTATVLIAMAAVALPTVLHRDTRTVAAAAPSTSPTSTSSASTPSAAAHTWPPAAIRPPALDRAALIHLSAGWTTEVRSFLAHRLPAAGGVTVQPWGGEASGDVQDGQGYLDTFAVFMIGGHETAVSVSVEAPGHDTTSPSGLCAQETSSHCQITWQGASSAVVVDPLSQGDAKILTVRDYRADGSVVSATAYNYDASGSDTRVTMAEVPLTVAQLTALADDPVLSF